VSYSIELVDPLTSKVLELDAPHQMKGGTYQVGGTNQCYLNVTYNYSPHYKHFGPKGIRTLYDMTGAESIPVIKQVMEKLGDDVDFDYWKPTEGNAKRALTHLLALAQLRPDGVWTGD
jgi:hypothetical protein